MLVCPEVKRSRERSREREVKRERGQERERERGEGRRKERSEKEKEPHTDRHTHTHTNTQTHTQTHTHRQILKCTQVQQVLEMGADVNQRAFALRPPLHVSTRGHSCTEKRQAEPSQRHPGSQCPHALASSKMGFAVALLTSYKSPRLPWIGGQQQTSFCSSC